MPPSQIALLGRQKALLHPVAQELASRKVATLMGGSDSFYGQVLDVLWLADKFEDMRDHGIGIEPGTTGRRVTMTDELRAEMRDRLGLDEPVYDEDEPKPKAKKSGRTAKPDALIRPKADRWEQFVAEFLRIPGSVTLEGVYRGCVRAYLRLCGGINAHKELRNALNRWEPLTRGFKSAAAMDAHIKRIAGQEVITYSTFHAAKGMEWDHVFVLNLTQGVMPDRRSLEGDRLDEERRLLYVAVTHARKRLWLCHSPVKVSGVRIPYKKRSAFLSEKAVLKCLEDGG